MNNTTCPRIPRHLNLNNNHYIHTGPAKGFGGHTFVRAADGHLHTFYIARVLRTGPQFSLVIVDGTALPTLRVGNASVSNGLNVGDMLLVYPKLGEIPTAQLWTKLDAPAPANAMNKPAIRQGSGVVETVFATGGGLISCIETKGRIYFGSSDIAVKPRVNALVRFFLEPSATRGLVAKSVTVV
jgi:hypothetical protein